jgi:hypothetical protein
MSNAFGHCARACGGAFLRREGGTTSATVVAQTAILDHVLMMCS